MSQKPRAINSFEFEGVVDGPQTSVDRNEKTESTIVIRQTNQWRDKFLVTAIEATTWGSDFNGLKGGELVFVRGRLNSKEYTHRETGQTKFWMKVVVDKLLKIQPAEELVLAPPAQSAEFKTDEIPF